MSIDTSTTTTQDGSFPTILTVLGGLPAQLSQSTARLAALTTDGYAIYYDGTAVWWISRPDETTDGVTLATDDGNMTLIAVDQINIPVAFWLNSTPTTFSQVADWATENYNPA